MADLRTYHQLLDAGSSAQQIRTAVAHGRLDRVRRGRYAVGPADWLARTRAVLETHPTAAASHGTAAALWGFAEPPDVVELTAPHGSALRSERGLLVRRTTRLLEPAEVRRVQATTPARTAVDLARTRPGDAGVVAADAALHAGVCTLDELQAAVASIRGLSGAAAAVRAIRLARVGAASPMETRLRLLVVRSGLPEPMLQVPVPTARRTYHVDLGWPEIRIGLEYDGARHHADDVRFARDRQRWRDLAAAGWLVLPISAEDMRTPARLAAEIVAAVRHAPAGGGSVAGVLPSTGAIGR